VHAVAVRDGVIVASAGDPALVAFLRSAAKPVQALPVARARPDLTQEEIAVACASHMARPDQLEHVRSLLAKAPATEEELECGPEPTPLEHNCSGKHAAMLALCRARGWPSEGYRLAEHPCQRAMLAEVARASELDVASIPTAVDGCGVVTFALPLERAARAFSCLPTAEGGDRVVAAMRARPELVRGQGSPDTVLMQGAAGWIAKAGAEGVLCAASPDGLGVALKVEDGGNRALGPAAETFLSRLGVEVAGLGRVEVRNSRSEVVGWVGTAAESHRRSTRALHGSASSD
jgi:L-asparaginase II